MDLFGLDLVCCPVVLTSQYFHFFHLNCHSVEEFVHYVIDIDDVIMKTNYDSSKQILNIICGALVLRLVILITFDMFLT